MAWPAVLRGKFGLRAEGEGMKTSFFRNALLAGAMVFPLAGPAWAAQWAQVDAWFWINLDRIETQEGFTYFAEVNAAQADVSPDVGGALGDSEPDLNTAINCATGEVYRRKLLNLDEYLDDETGTVQKQYEWVDETGRWDSQILARITGIVCNR